MSLLYLIDGYNLIKRSRFFKDKPLQAAREAFFSYIESHRPGGSARNQLIVVFDGPCDVSYLRPAARSFKVVFTSGETADERILKILERGGEVRAKNAVVVTDDKGLARGVRAAGARVMATDEFLKPRKTKPGASRESDEVKEDLNIVEKEKITEELKKIWLREGLH